MELALSLDELPALQAAPILRRALAGELADIEELSRTAHCDTRFFKDAKFPARTAADLYAAWIRRDFELHHILVVPGAQRGIAGYITCQHDQVARVGRVGLFAVSAAERRRGLGDALLTGALQWFRAVGCQEVRVVTQASNVAAQRTYQKLGFRTTDTRFTYHRWFQAT
jgi:ribosomal protein S18 acetylase RimI-like enzyme